MSVCCDVHRCGLGVQGGQANAPPIFFLPNSFFGYWVEEGQIKKQKSLQNNYLGGVKAEKIENLHFTEGIGVPATHGWFLPPTSVISQVMSMVMWVCQSHVFDILQEICFVTKYL
jgi:hypothetical protein